MERVLAGRYALEVEIAEGSIGAVWRAKDLQANELVAVKLLRHEAADDPEVVSGFREEAKVLAQLNHPGVVRPRDFVAADGDLALVMDLVDGTDLRRRIQDAGPLPPVLAVDITAQVAEALAAVHAAGIVHGDVKPGNILVPADGGPVRLADFGVAHRVHGAAATHGTPEYVAPEVIEGASPEPASDIYSLGIVLYEALSGRSPFRGGPVAEVLKRHQTCVALMPPGMPPQVWELIARCLQKDPRARPSAGEMAAALRAMLPSLADLRAAPELAPEVVTYQPRDAMAALQAAPVSPAPDNAGVPVSPGPAMDSGAPAGLDGAPLSGWNGPTPTPEQGESEVGIGLFSPPPAGDLGSPTMLVFPDAAPPSAPDKTDQRRGRFIAIASSVAAAVVLLLFVGFLVISGGDGSGESQEPANYQQESSSPAPEQSSAGEPSEGATEPESEPTTEPTSESTEEPALPDEEEDGDQEDSSEDRSGNGDEDETESRTNDRIPDIPGNGNPGPTGPPGIGDPIPTPPYRR